MKTSTLIEIMLMLEVGLTKYIQATRVARRAGLGEIFSRVHRNTRNRADDSSTRSQVCDHIALDAVLRRDVPTAPVRATKILSRTFSDNLLVR